MWTPFLAHELYKYRLWIHPASSGLPRLLWPNNFGKIPRNSSKKFLKKWTHQERGRRGTQVTRNGTWARNEKNSHGGRHSCSRPGGQPSQTGREEKGFGRADFKKMMKLRDIPALGYRKKCLTYILMGLKISSWFKVSAWRPSKFYF